MIRRVRRSASFFWHTFACGHAYRVERRTIHCECQTVWPRPYVSSQPGDSES